MTPVDAPAGTVTTPATGMPDIGSLIPHTGVMILLDRVVSADAEGLCAEVGIHKGSLFYAGGGVAGWVGLEYMAQAIAAYAGYCAKQLGQPVKVGFLLGSRHYHCRLPRFVNGSVLRVQVQRVVEGVNGLGAFECRIDVLSNLTLAESDITGSATVEPVATATITVFQPENAIQFLQGSHQ